MAKMRKLIKITVALCLVVFSVCLFVACTKNDDTTGGDGKATIRKVLFDLNYEKAPEQTPVEVENGERVLKPEDPVRDGYSFVGWFLDADCMAEESFTTGKTKASNSPVKDITADITFYACWKPALVSISAVFVGKVYVNDGSVKGITTTATYKDGATNKVEGVIGAIDTSTAGEKEVTVTYTEGNVTKECTVIVTVTEKNTDPGSDPTDDKATLYFYNNRNFASDTVYAYAWAGESKQLGEWPGSVMSALSQHSDWYSVKVDKKAVNMIFSNNGSQQTASYTIDYTKPYMKSGKCFASVEDADAYVPDVSNSKLYMDFSAITWHDSAAASFYCYIWYVGSGDNGEYPGVAMTLADDIYSVEFDSEKTVEGIVFTRRSLDGTSEYNKFQLDSVSFDATKSKYVFATAGDNNFTGEWQAK